MCSLCPPKPSKSTSQKEKPGGGEDIESQGPGWTSTACRGAAERPGARRVAGSEVQEITREGSRRPFSWNAGILKWIFREGREQRSNNRYFTLSILGLFYRKIRLNTIHCRGLVRVARDN